jgi:glycogen(starch) synthase
MKILISSYAFAPSIGGIETVSALLADEFVRLGASVTLITETPVERGGDGNAGFPFPVVRNPSAAELLRLVRWCDVVWHNNLSLRAAWPLLFFKRPFFITHAGSYCAKPTGIDLRNRLKHAVVNRAVSVALNQSVADSFTVNSVIIPNPFDARVFKNRVPWEERRGELVFVGRLYTEKGLHFLVQALGWLRQKGVRPRLTVIGDGPEMPALKQMAAEFGVLEQISFAGRMRSEAIADILNQHKIQVVPSRNEAFGVAALEGIACGCVVVGAGVGGLPATIGQCGVTYAPGDIQALAQTLEGLLGNPDAQAQFTRHGGGHLAQFHPTTVTQRYLELFSSSIV